MKLSGFSDFWADREVHKLQNIVIHTVPLARHERKKP